VCLNGVGGDQQLLREHVLLLDTDGCT
jgi:hypothetical protein